MAVWPIVEFFRMTIGIFIWKSRGWWICQQSNIRQLKSSLYFPLRFIFCSYRIVSLGSWANSEAVAAPNILGVVHERDQRSKNISLLLKKSLFLTFRRLLSYPTIKYLPVQNYQISDCQHLSSHI